MEHTCVIRSDDGKCELCETNVEFKNNNFDIGEVVKYETGKGTLRNGTIFKITHTITAEKNFSTYYIYDSYNKISVNRRKTKIFKLAD
jgi:hypothetical protein